MQSLIAALSKKPLKPFYNGLVPRPIRKRWNYQYLEIPKQQRVASYWQEVISLKEQDKLSSYAVDVKKPELIGKKIIWQYWAQGMQDLPEMAKLCFASVDRYHGDYEIIRLSDETVDEYIQLPEFVSKKLSSGTFSRVFYSDLLRTALIASYGGVWLDASILLTDSLPQVYADCDYFMFSRDADSPNQSWGINNDHFYFNWNSDFKVKHLSSVMYGKADNELLTTALKLLLYFWETQNDLPHYFTYQILINELVDSGFIDSRTLIVDDTLPHLLQNELNRAFDSNRYEAIVAATQFHKLTFHTKFKEKNNRNQQTFYGYLLQHYQLK